MDGDGRNTSCVVDNPRRAFGVLLWRVNRD